MNDGESNLGKWNNVFLSNEVDKLTEQQLKDNILTLDYRGREFKKLCLEKLLNMAKLQINVVKILDERR